MWIFNLMALSVHTILFWHDIEKHNLKIENQSSNESWRVFLKRVNVEIF